MKVLSSPLLVFVLFALVCSARAAVVTYMYRQFDNTVHQWNNGSIWDTGVAPVAGDDVVIIGFQGSFDGHIIQLPDTIPNLNSLTINAQDIQISLPNTLVLTTTNLIFGDGGFLLRGATTSNGATATIVVTSVLSTANTGEKSPTVTYVNLNISSTATATWQAGASVQFFTINNLGTWIWLMNYGFDMDVQKQGPFTINNYGTMSIEYGPGGYDEGTLTVYGNVNLYSGTFNIAPNCALQMGYPSDSRNVQYYLNHYATLNIQGFLRPTNNANITFRAGSKTTGNGTIFYRAFKTGSYLIIEQDFSWGDVTLISYTGIYQNNFALNITRLNLVGGILNGAGPIIAQNVSSIGEDNGYTSGTYLLGRNLTVTGFWDMWRLPNFNLGRGAFITTAPSSTIFMLCAATFQQYTGDSSKVGFISYGYWYPDLFQYCTVQFSVPSWFYGTYVYPVDWTGVTGTTGTGIPVGFSGTKGGVFAGNITTVKNIIGDYGSDDLNWIYGLRGGPFVITPTAHFYGGIFTFSATCENLQYTSISCYLPGFYSFQGRAPGTTVGDAIMVSDGYSTMSMDGPNIVFENYWAQTGQLTGDYNLTITNGIRDDSNRVGISLWQINKTSLIVTGTFNVTQYRNFKYVNGGKIIINPGAVLNLVYGLIDNWPDLPAGIYNYGNIILQVTQDQAVSFVANCWNYGNISLVTAITDSSLPYGATLSLGNYFQPQSTGTIMLTAYTASDYDKISWTTYNTNCAFNGVLQYNFQYTAKPNDRFQLFKTGLPSCSGLFTLKANVPTGHTAVLQYDVRPQDSSEQAAYFYMIVCANTNQSCIDLGKRDPSKQNPSSTSSGTSAGTSSGTTSSTSSGTSSPSSGSSTTASSSAPLSSPSSPLLVILLVGFTAIFNFM